MKLFINFPLHSYVLRIYSNTQDRWQYILNICVPLNQKYLLFLLLLSTEFQNYCFHKALTSILNLKMKNQKVIILSSIPVTDYVCKRNRQKHKWCNILTHETEFSHFYLDSFVRKIASEKLGRRWTLKNAKERSDTPRKHSIEFLESRTSLF